MLQRAAAAAEFLGIWVGPVGMRPASTRLPQVKPALIHPGVYLLVKARLGADPGHGRQRAPVEVCRVRMDKDMPEDFGEATKLPVEFLFSDE